MAVWVISDLHLSLNQPFVPGSVPQLYKPMATFGEKWYDHVTKLYINWQRLVAPEDIVFVPGDVSWAMRLPELEHDLAFLGSLPGRIYLSKGNHDFWWETKNKVAPLLPPNVRLLQHEACRAEGLVAAATRGWYCPGSQDFDVEAAKIYRRECLRVEMALQQAAQLNQEAGGGLETVLLLHFPPVNDKWDYNELIELMQKNQVTRCFYGHLHGGKSAQALQGERWGIEFALVSTDFLAHQPLLIMR